MADETFDCVIMGTGLIECILSGLLCVDKRRVLHIDKNNYYGGEGASLNLNQLFQKFRKGAAPPPYLGQSKEYNVDLVPKYIMGSGLLVDMLLHCGVHRYLDFKCITGSYVYKKEKIHKVPCTQSEALKSSLMGLFEKRRFQKFLEFCGEFDEKNPKTTKGFEDSSKTGQMLFKEFGLDEETTEFIGHAVALYSDESYLKDPAKDVIRAVMLYFDSLAKYEKSPYLYPLYGLGDLPQSFARLAAIYSGTFILHAPVEKVEKEGDKFVINYSYEGKPMKSYADFIVADPTYFPDKVKKVGQVVRMICILDHPIPNTEDPESVQIIIPRNQVHRKHDIYVCSLSNAHQVVPTGKWLAFVSTQVETDDPVKELAPGVKLLGPILESFVDLADCYEPLEDGTKNKIFISNSYDASTHFESTIEQVLMMYRKIQGKELEMKISMNEPAQ